MVNPYDDFKDGDTIIRVFQSEVLEDSLVWHQDKRNRVVTVLEGENWLFQFDDELPFKLKINDTLHIEAYRYHRLIRGETNLVLRIREM